MNEEDQLLTDLEAAEGLAELASPSCGVCLTLAQMSDKVRPAVESALAGKVGERKLSEILRSAGYPVGRRAIYHHRSGHGARRG